jgi:hypothetical protein
VLPEISSGHPLLEHPPLFSVADTGRGVNFDGKKKQ